MSATLTLKTWRVTIFSKSVWSTNGPVPLVADQIATPEAIRAAGAAPRRWNRQAVVMIRGRTRYSSRSRFWNRTYVTIAVVASSPASSRARHEVRAGAERRARMLRRRGATSKTPIASPAHQTAQVGQN